MNLFAAVADLALLFGTAAHDLSVPARKKAEKIIIDGMPTLKPKVIGDHRMETTVARQQYPAKAF